ncbi:MAG: hypothetical protein ACYSUI_19605 [Planctomycetota bacterium]|jgi:hypothetical protein
MAPSTFDLMMPLFQPTAYRRIWEALPAEERRQAILLLADLLRQYAEVTRGMEEADNE